MPCCICMQVLTGGELAVIERRGVHVSSLAGYIPGKSPRDKETVLPGLGSAHSSVGSSGQALNRLLVNDVIVSVGGVALPAGGDSVSVIKTSDSWQSSTARTAAIKREVLCCFAVALMIFRAPAWGCYRSQAL